MSQRQSRIERRTQLSPAKLALLEKWKHGAGECLPIQPHIPTRTVKEHVPLSFAQQRLWFLDQLLPGNTSYNLPAALKLSGNLDVSFLKMGIQTIVHRHESLRTTFAFIDEQPVQIIAHDLQIPIPVFDLSALVSTQQEGCAFEIVTGEINRPFDLTKGPLLRICLIRLQPQEHLLLFIIHHIISDNWSMGVFLKELTQLYASYRRGTPTHLPKLPIHYADYALWQRELLQGDELEQRLTYWRQQLSNAHTFLNLPTDFPRPPILSMRGASLRFALTPALTRDLKAVSQREGLTLFMVLLAGFAILLSRYSGQEDILIGTPIAGREFRETEELIGLFTNMLVIRADLTGNPDIRHLLKRLKEVCVQAYEHQDLPFEKIVEMLNPDRSLSHNPLFQTCFAMQNTPGKTVSLPEISFSPFPLTTRSTKFDLWLSMEEQNDVLHGIVEYSVDLFEETTIARFITHFQRILEGITSCFSTHLSDLPVLTDQELQGALQVARSLQPVEGTELCLHQLFEQQVAKSPDAIAISCEDEVMTYMQLNARANCLAHYLRSQGVGPGMRVGLVMERTFSMLIGILGILKTGAAYVPVDPRYPLERQYFLLQDADICFLVTQQAVNERCQTPIPQLSVDDPEGEWLLQSEKNLEDVVADPDTAAYLIYTSGSTGRPKGVVVSHRNVCRLFAHTRPHFHLSQDDVWTLFHSFAFDFSVWELWGPLLHGGRLVIVPYWVSRTPESLLRLIREQAVTILNQTPSAFAALIPWVEELPGSLRLVIFGGEALEVAGVQAWTSRFGWQHPQLVNMYGITETTVHVTAHLLTQQDAALAGISVIGRPLADLQVYVLDRSGQMVPQGAVGELYVGGAGLSQGYWGQAAMTAERFVPHCYSEQGGQRLYRTGDLGRVRANGELEYLGRADQQVKIRGFRIEPGEIEAFLSQHPQVQKALVRVREGQQLIAYVVEAAGEQKLQAGDLRRFMQVRVPDYMVPATFITLDHFPLTAHGKVDLSALPAPDSHQSLSNEQYVAPRNAMEQTLASLFKEVLQLERVGIHDNFFEIGGDSTRSIQIVTRAKQRGFSLSPQQIFQYQTIAELAQMVPPAANAIFDQECAAVSLRSEEDAASTAYPLARLSQPQLQQIRAEKGDVEDIYPLGPIQRYMLEKCLIEPQPGMYVIHHLYQLADLKVQVFRRVVQALVDAHPVLRTSFAWVGVDEPVQVVHKNIPVPLIEVDLSNLAPDEQEQCITLYIETVRHRGFDLTRAPQSHMAVFRQNEHTYRFFWAFNYMLQDGWSYPFLLDNIFSLYSAFLQGLPFQITPPRSYRDYIAWVQQQDLQAAEHYWQETLQAFTQPTPLIKNAPVNAHRSETGYRGRYIDFSAEDTRQIEAFASKYHVTVYTLIQATWALLLSVYTGEQNVVYGSVVGGRPTDLAGIENMIGAVNNVLPLYVSVAQEKMMLPWLSGIQANHMAMMQYEYSSLVQIKQWIRLPEHVSLFESEMSFENGPIPPSVMRQIQAINPDRKRRSSALAQTDAPVRLTIWHLQQLQVILTYDRSLFCEASITRIFQDFELVLKAILAHPQSKLGEVIQFIQHNGR